MRAGFIDLRKEGDHTIIVCQGSWTLYEADRIEKAITALVLPASKHCLIDFGEVEKFDSTGILLLRELQEHLRHRGCSVTLRNLDAKQRKILKLLREDDWKSSLPQRKEGFLYRIGRVTFKEWETLHQFLAFVGEMSVAFGRLFLHPGSFRLRETVYHIEKSGFDALFIIALTSILVGLVIAYQSLVQLAQFGADIFVVDAIGISITRELGPMITAIVIAGRSASSYTAEIGTMKITEEINAMQTMGFDPIYFLVVPRVVALVVAMPLVIFFADIAGILGGMLATKAQVGLSYSFFLDRLQEVLNVKHYILGIIKGPFFALIIAATGCFHGFRVTSDTESIGIETTASVVHAIFFVIACDALFSVIFTELGW